VVKLKFILPLLVLITIRTQSIAQDIHFSMFNMSPLTLNPANTGVMDGDFRLTNILRSQWKAIGDPLNSLALTYDRQLYALPHNLSAGLVLTSDKSGGIKLSENKLLFTTAIKHYFGKDILSVGMQIGVASKTLSWDGTTFPSQYSHDIGLFDASLPNGETSLKLNRIFLDVNAGLLFRKATAIGPLTIGLSTFHLNRPDDSFYRNGNGLQPRYVFHSDYNIQISQLWNIKPSVLMMSLNKAQDFIFTTSAGVNLKKEKDSTIEKIWFGLGWRSGINRNADSFYPTVGLDLKHFQIAGSFDVNYSTLQAATNQRGAFEIALIYTSLNSAITKTTIPCDRF
jgi:type IX secretion system PorP/SprF family membrane protein